MDLLRDADAENRMDSLNDLERSCIPRSKEGICRDPHALQICHEFARDPDASVRLAALQVLGKVSPTIKAEDDCGTTLQLLIDLLRDESDSVRLETCSVVAKVVYRGHRGVTGRIVYL